MGNQNSISRKLAWALPATAFLIQSCGTPQKQIPEPPSTVVTTEPELKTSWERGLRAMGRKDAPTAVREFEACVKETSPKLKAHLANCNWELGWAYFLNQNFIASKQALETALKLGAKREDVAKVMKRAKAHADLETQIQKLTKTAPPTFQNPGYSSAVLKILAVGDTMIGTDFPPGNLPSETAPHGGNILANITPALQGADVTFVNYEGTLCDSGVSEKCDKRSTGSCYAFRTPTRFAKFVKSAGFDVASLANNHIMDFGEDCRKATEDALTTQGIEWSGRDGTVARFERNGIPISLISFHSARHTNTTVDLPRAKFLVGEEVKAGRLVIASFHGGAEGFEALKLPNKMETYFGEPRGNVMAFSRAVVDAGADLVLGSGPHVVRGMEIYKDRLIAYSLGNFATYKTFNLTGYNGVGAILEVDIDRDGRFVSGRLNSTRQTGYGIPEVDTRGVTKDLVRLLSARDLPGTGVKIAQDATLGRSNEKPASKKTPSPIPAIQKLVKHPAGEMTDALKGALKAAFGDSPKPATSCGPARAWFVWPALRWREIEPLLNPETRDDAAATHFQGHEIALWDPNAKAMQVLKNPDVSRTLDETGMHIDLKWKSEDNSQTYHLTLSSKGAALSRMNGMRANDIRPCLLSTWWSF